MKVNGTEKQILCLNLITILNLVLHEVRTKNMMENILFLFLFERNHLVESREKARAGKNRAGKKENGNGKPEHVKATEMNLLSKNAKLLTFNSVYAANLFSK